MTLHSFTCDHCGGTFKSEAEEADLLKEEHDNFGFNEVPEHRAVVCDDCYAKVMGWWDHAKNDAENRKIIEQRKRAVES